MNWYKKSNRRGVNFSYSTMMYDTLQTNFINLRSGERYIAHLTQSRGNLEIINTDRNICYSFSKRSLNQQDAERLINDFLNGSNNYDLSYEL